MSKSENKNNTAYLTETILTIHNEVQTALDHISTMAKDEITDTESTAILSIQNLRIKIPMKFNLEITEKPIEESSNITKGAQLDSNYTREAQRELSLANRAGFIVSAPDTITPTVASYSKLAINLQLDEPNKNASQNETTVESKKEAWGEIEIVFAPLKRQ